MSDYNEMIKDKTALPEGFDRESVDADGVFGEAQQKRAQQLRFGGRGGGGMRGRTVEKPKEGKKTLRRLLDYFKAEKNLFFMLLTIVLAVTICAVISPAVQGKAIDTIKDKSWHLLTKMLLDLILVYLINSTCMLLQNMLSARLSQRIVRKMRGDLFNKVDHLKIKYLDTHSSGDIMSRMTNDVENISNTVSQSLGSLLSGLLNLVGTISIMFYYCWQLTLCCMGTVIATLILTKLLSAPMRKAYQKRSKILGQLNGLSEEMITGYQNVVAYNRQTDVIKEFDTVSDDLMNTSIKAELLGSIMGPLMNCISNIGFVIVAAIGGMLAIKGVITIGTISAFIIYAKQFSRPINEMAQLYGSIQTALAGAERVFEILDQPQEDNSAKTTLGLVTGHIALKNISFSYTENKPVIRNFSLDVNPGEKIALVGATGSGKTTIVNLLMRFYDIDSGEIYIDGTNISDVSRDELRNNIAIVLQDTVIFSDTVRRNIKYADQSVSEDKMIEAAQISNCADFISRLPEKYDTVLKQSAANLSQGQRQLLAIARAVVADPKILILDEATSSVDTRTETNIQNAMVNLMKDRTSLIIAHRLSTVRDADVIVVMDDGKIVEKGTHDELIDAKGKYYELYMTQYEGLNI